MKLPLTMVMMFVCASLFATNTTLDYNDRFDLYSSFHFTENPLNQDVFNYAFKGYLRLRDAHQLSKNHILSIIDYSKPSSEKRFWVLDLNSRTVLFTELVSHGERSGALYAKSFSNVENSHQSSLGFFVTGDTYYGKNAFSLKLHGKESRFNSNAYKRGIVIHGASYVSQNFVTTYQRLGRSFGCPAVRQEIHNQLISTIANGSCLFAYYPSSTYLQYSSLLN